jgi:multiple sugar transport system substrate-binding protein
MPDFHLRGITWNHRRAIDPLTGTLDRFHAQHPETTIQWMSRPLHGFEFTPVLDLAKEYDLIVLDHPFVGDIAAAGCLLPLDELLGADDREAFVGPSLAAYRFDGRLWAVPIDAACQTAVSRPDLLTRLDQSPPEIWSDVVELGRMAVRAGYHLAIGLRGVHSLMTFFTLCANLGSPCSDEPNSPLVDHETACTSLALLRELVSLCPEQILDWNSIDLHDAMVARDDLIFCPAVYCYATYAEPDQRRPLRFHDLPGPCGCRGSTIGGTGLGISASCKFPELAKSYVRFAASVPAQLAFADHHGQPARSAVWENAAINQRFGGCYRATRTTIEQSWIRPRYAGYLGFQAKAGPLIEQHLRGVLSEADLLETLETLHRQSGKSPTR